jgi:hypothetical protein
MTNIQRHIGAKHHSRQGQVLNNPFTQHTAITDRHPGWQAKTNTLMPSLFLHDSA